MSDKVILQLLAMIDAIDKINRFIGGMKDSDEFFNDIQGFDAVMMNFVVIGEMVIKINEEFKLSHPEVEWSKIIKFRVVSERNPT